MYAQDSISWLQEKLDYEIWLLDFLSKSEDTFEGGAEISSVKLTNRQESASISVSLCETLGAGSATKVIDSMRPLVFTARYKLIDMIHEWILEENEAIGIISKVPWRFSEKIKLLASSPLQYPPLFNSYPFVKDYLFALYVKLLDFRNEIVHNHNFSLTSDKLVINSSKSPNNPALELDRKEVGFMVRAVTATGQALTVKLLLNDTTIRMLRYHLDQISKLHELPKFGQAQPSVINVELTVPQEGEVFPADLTFVRERVSRIFPEAEVIFNLKLIGLMNGQPPISWFFPAESVPPDGVFEIRADEYPDFRT